MFPFKLSLKAIETTGIFTTWIVDFYYKLVGKCIVHPMDPMVLELPKDRIDGKICKILRYWRFGDGSRKTASQSTSFGHALSPGCPVQEVRING